jgi:hypothetical protein
VNIEDQKFEEWAIVELMGHVTLAGLVSEQSLAGTALLRIDVPTTENQPAFTKLVGGGAIYAITPTTEEIVRAAANRLSVRPVTQWVVPDPPRRRELIDSMADEPDEDEEYEENSIDAGF